MLFQNLPKGCSVAIWGAGGRGKSFELRLGELRPDVKVVCYVDTYKTGQVGPTSIIGPDSLAFESFDYLVLASDFAMQIWKTIPVEVKMKTLYYDPCQRPLAAYYGKRKKAAVLSTFQSELETVNFANLPTFAFAESVQVVHMDPMWTLGYYYDLEPFAQNGGIIPLAEASADDYDGAYVIDEGNEFSLQAFFRSPLGRLLFLNPGKRAVYRNTTLAVQKRFPAVNVLELGSIFSVSGGEYSTLAVAELMRPEDRFMVVNMHADAIENTKLVCRGHREPEYYCRHSSDFIRENALRIGELHAVFMQHVGAPNELVVEEFARLDELMVPGALIYFTMAASEPHPELEPLCDRLGYEGIMRSPLYWVLEKK